jgi:CubicO group peptidase (beta-lactamase class C family)
LATVTPKTHCSAAIHSITARRTAATLARNPRLGINVEGRIVPHSQAHHLGQILFAQWRSLTKAELFSLGALLLGLVACSDAPTSPIVQGLDPVVLAEGVARIRAGDYGDMHSLLVYRNDEVVLEEYFHGTGPDTRMSIESVTKSVASALVGMALAEGSLADGIDTPVLDLFPEYAAVDNPSALKDDMRLEHALTMTTGLAWDEWTLEYQHPLNSWQQMLASPDWSKFVLDRPMVATPGTHFVYNTGASLLLSRVVEQTVGMTASAYAAEELFQPLGITSWSWPSSPEGHSITGEDLELTAPDMAKIGLLMLDRGRWNGEQLIPEAWVDLSTAAHVGQAEGVETFEYGFQWWRFRDDLTVAAALGVNDAFFAWGNGGQFIIVVPHWRMVVVMTGANYTSGNVDSTVQLGLVRDYVFAAVIE